MFDHMGPYALISLLTFSLSLQEAKNAFKALLESAHVEADWSWEQVMNSKHASPSSSSSSSF